MTKTERDRPIPEGKVRFYGGHLDGFDLPIPDDVDEVTEETLKELGYTCDCPWPHFVAIRAGPKKFWILRDV